MAEMSVIWLRVAAGLYSLGLLHAILTLVPPMNGHPKASGASHEIPKTAQYAIIPCRERAMHMLAKSGPIYCVSRPLECL
jgi:hypothetical protein